MERQKEESFIGYFLVIGLMLVLSPATLNTAFATPPSGTTWTLVWSDEFSGESIDADKWAWGVLPWGGYHQGGSYVSYTTADDSYLEDGSLILRSREGDFGGQPWSQGFMFGHEWPYYGYGEIRAKHTKADGIWVGFWMLHYGWPPEFDIAEYYGTDDKMRMGLCYPPGTWDRVFVGPEDWENWHTYGMEWGPRYAYFYMDDELTHSINASYVPDLPMYLMLQSGMDGTYDEQTPNPNYYEVDYMRWYKDDNLPRYQDPNILPRIIDCTHDDVTYSGTWDFWEGNPVWMGNVYYSDETDAVAEFSFTGTKVAYYSSKRNDLGHVEILLDDELVDTIDCYQATWEVHQNLYQSPELDYGAHTLGIRVKGTKNPASSGVEVIVDAFRYSTYSGSYCGDSTCDEDESRSNCICDCSSEPPPEVGDNFFTASYTGTRNDFDGCVGYEFEPTEDITIDALGRSVSTTMDDSHDVKIFKVSDQSVVAYVCVASYSPEDGLGYAYEGLEDPVVLLDGVKYRIASEETNGGDRWREIYDGLLSSHSAKATITKGVYGYPGTYPSYTHGGTDEGYVPPTFYYVSEATPGVTISESEGSTDVAEEGPTSDTYTVVLDTLPSDTVTITVDPDIDTEVNSAGAGNSIQLTFTTSNWYTAQTVTVTAIDDQDVEGAHTSTITHAAASSDNDYNGISIDNVVANVTDNDGGCTPTDMHIESVVCAEVRCGGPNRNGRATVTIYDDCGDPVANADVDGTFTGDFSESFYDVQTDQYGEAVFTTAGCVRKPSFTFTVTDVDHGTLPYDSGDDITDNCSG